MSRMTRRYTRPLEVRQVDVGKYFQHATSTIQPGDRVIVCGRVSEHPQQLAGNLDDQAANLCAEMVRLGAQVVGKHLMTWSGCDPGWLVRAVVKARNFGAKYLVFESVDRAIRSEHFHPFLNPEAVATETDLEYLRYFTEGLPLLTLLPPNATPSEIRSYQRKRGQRLKGQSKRLAGEEAAAGTEAEPSSRASPFG